MMTRLPCLLLAATLPVAAQSVTSDPIGFNKVTCLANSDTIVGVPLRKEGSQQTKLAAPPTIAGDSATLTLSATNLGILNNHYLKFNSGVKDGSWYHVTGNTADSIIIELNGEILDGAATDDSVIIAEYWTLDSLFPPALATTDPATTGHAIVASTNTLATGRRTEVMLPNVLAEGINNPSAGRYYIHNGIWKKSASGNTDFGKELLPPDNLFTIRHPQAVTANTTFRSTGEVELGTCTVPLFTQETSGQDNYIAIQRPITVTLDGLNLKQSGAFMPSTNTLATGRRDQLLFFDNELQLINKSPSAIYYVHNGIWKRSAAGNDDRGGDLIPAGAGFIIRKYQVLGKPTSFWANSPTYDNI